ncbi:hypothetical protein SI65_05163 [Aspergillus cristatus]|uniref:Extracellular protein n=1 Tax=Aspergillus cristatus TaxID=573508 RepID=A0A1E3BGR9_ASPCR|nr:hypothetical protein SI65_05163 [Aspergillus cristatus]
MKNFLLAVGILASSASAHMQMSEPFPIRSPLNKDNNGKKDYSYTNPLSTDGSDFPCKGYANDPFNATANYNPGGSYPLKLAGSATHDGGSCQISLSYDKGKSFHVIHSILGGCPIDKEYKFTVPSDAPSGEALLAWSWFNKVGNREMYMNCAQVNIASEGGSQNREMIDAADNDANNDANNATTHATDAQGFDSLPPIFIANVNGPGKCETTEGKDVNFPKPGPSVEGSVEGKGYKCEGDADFLTSDSDSGSSTTSSSDSSESSSSHNANAPMSSSILDYQRNGGVQNKHAVAFGDAASEPRFGPPAGAPAPQGHGSSGSQGHGAPAQGHGAAGPQGQATHGHGQGHGHGHSNGGKPQHAWGPPGGIICSPDGKSFSRCTANGPPIDMGPVAEGTICRDGKITWA